MAEQWRSRAACRDHPDPDMFFPNPTDVAGRQRAAVVCARCPVVTECLDGANQRRERHGVWGGLGRTDTGRPARPPGRPPRSAGLPLCGTAAGYRAHIAAAQPPCTGCRDAANLEYESKYAKSFALMEARRARREAARVTETQETAI